MGRFSATAKAEARLTRKYFAKGKYRVRIAEVEAYDAEGLCVAVKCEIISSSNPAIEAGEIRQVSWPLSKKRHPGPQFFKTFIAAAMGMDPNDEKITTEEWEKVCELVVSSKQPLAGKILDAEVNEVVKNGEVMKTKSGEAYTNIEFKLAKAEAA